MVNLSLFAGYSQALTQLTYIQAWGSSAVIASSSIAHIAVGQNNNVYITDTTNHRIKVFDFDGNLQYQFGSEGWSTPGKFKFPTGIAVSSANNYIYVADSANHRIQYFSEGGVFVGEFGGSGNQNGQFSYPNGITINSLGDIYVADSLNNRVQVFSSTGQFKFTFGSLGSSTGQMRYPMDVAITQNGDLFVTDLANHRIQKFKSNGAFLAEIGSYGGGIEQFVYPKGIASSPLGTVFVADTGNHKIEKFNSSGVYLSSVGTGINGVQFNSAQDLAVASNGHVFIADSGNKNVIVFANDGSYVAQFSYDDNENDGKFNSPAGINYSHNQTKIFVADTGNNRIQVFNRDGQFIDKFGEYGDGNGQFNEPISIDEDSSGKIYIVDRGNNRIQIFSATGNYISQINDISGVGDGFFYAGGIAISKQDKIYVVDIWSAKIKEYDLNGNFVDEFGEYGNNQTQFTNLSDVAVDDSGNIYVSDTDNNRIQVFSSAYQFLRGFGLQGQGDGELNSPKGLDIKGDNIFVTDSDNSRIQVFDLNGNYISQIGRSGTNSSEFSSPDGITVDVDDYIYVADTGNNRIQKFKKSSISDPVIGGGGNGSGGGSSIVGSSTGEVTPPEIIVLIIPIDPIITTELPFVQQQEIVETITNNNSFIPKPIREIVSNTRDSINANITAPLSSIVASVEEITPEPIRVYAPKTIMTSGLLFGSVAMITDNLFGAPFAFSQLIFYPSRIWASLLALFGITKRRRPWGSVYDTITKFPIDPVHLELVNKDGYVVAKTMTDIYGRYSFNVAPGHYMLRPKKEGYVFPSLILAHMTRDEIYKNLYFGNYFQIKYAGEMISKNIPMDRSKMDWKEFAEADQKILNWIAKRDDIIGNITNILFVLGFIISGFALLLAPGPYNIIIFFMYIIMLLLRRAGANPSKLGKITDGSSKNPLAFAIVRVFSVKLGNEVVRKVTNKYGQFFCPVPDGEYYLSFDRKNQNGTYTEASKKERIEVNRGVISGKWSAVFQ